MAAHPPASCAEGRSVEYGLGDRSVGVSPSNAEGVVESTPASCHDIATSVHIPSNSLTIDWHHAVCVLTLGGSDSGLYRVQAAWQ
jgi:hypothetical protein